MTPDAPPPSPFAAFSAALTSTQRLLGGRAGRKRWRPLAGLAIMAGVVGAGPAPPPLGMLVPIWQNGTTREALLGAPVVVPLVTFLAVLLTLMGFVARMFGLAFVEGIASAEPDLARFRAYSHRGSAHFAWSSALTIPLYVVLFAGEGAAARGTLSHLLDLLATGMLEATDVTSTAVSLSLEIMAVLVPWTLLTLPAMFLMYELTPAAMVTRGGGPVRACSRVLARIRRWPGRFAGYVGVRFLLQIAGNAVALLALVPSLLAGGFVSAPLIVAGWAASQALGGATTSGGIAALSVSVMLALVAVYCVLCTLLVPVAVLINAFAISFVSEV